MSVFDETAEHPSGNAPQGASSADDETIALLNEIRQAQAEHRAEVQALRQELAAAKAHTNLSTTPAPFTPPTVEELQAARMADVSQHDFYCPGCGKLVDYRQQCNGRPEAPHPPIEVVSTDELKAGDPSKHTRMSYANQSDRTLLGIG